ncbi:MAG TPA: peptide deformylase [Actinopolymorphaceae bacterium]
MGELPTDGQVRPITRWGEPVMHRRCRPVEAYDAELATLVADMVATMRAADGVGLAANQIGVDLQVFVYSCPDADQVIQEGVVCNPILELPTGSERRLEEAEEGCLSLPGAYAKCPRPDTAVVRGFDVSGQPIVVSGTGMLARCLQHETDHLQGVVFADRLSQRVRRQLFRDAEAVAERYGPRWPAE